MDLTLFSPAQKRMMKHYLPTWNLFLSHHLAMQLIGEIMKPNQKMNERNTNSPEQLQFANKIRHLTDQFRHKASHTMKNTDRSKANSMNILKELAKDKSIVITRSDKGRPVVILNREEYLQKMQSSIGDRTRFERINHDPIITEEDRWIRKLRHMRQRKFITDQEFDYYYPSGSQPGTLYGLPKAHKDRIPLRPILSVSRTFNCGIARLLVNRLSYLKQHPTTIRDTFSLVDDLHYLQLKMMEHRLISFDVANLFTNVPLEDTIEIILNELYQGKCQSELGRKYMYLYVSLVEWWFHS